MSYYYVANPLYSPAMANISAITQANPAVITTTADVDYVIGQTCRVYLPNGWGMPQMNNLVVTITQISGTSLTTNVDSTLFFPFTTPSPVVQVAQLVPVGEIAETLLGATFNTHGYNQ